MSSSISKEDGRKLRTPLQSDHGSAKLSKELSAQPVALPLVPAVCIFDIRGRGRTE
jgi:hypothetical protein